MNDCVNVDVRDRLPDLVNGSLSPSEAHVVQRHIEACIDCQEELVVLRSVRAMLRASSPAVNVAAILSALPVAARPTTRFWSSWRVAAAITVVVIGSGTVAVLSRGGAAVPRSDQEPVAMVPAAPTAESAAVESSSTEMIDPMDVPVASSPSRTASGAEMTVSASIGGLSDSQVEGLIDRIGQVEAIPLGEPVPRATVPTIVTDKVEVKDLGGSH